MNNKATIGKAMAVAVDRGNAKRQAILTVFHKALGIAKSETIKTGESKTVLTGALRGQRTEIFLLRVGNRLTLNLKWGEKTFPPMLMSETANESSYLKWNAKITTEMDGPNPAPPVRPLTRPTTRQSNITDPKTVSKKAKGHDVTPLDHDTYRVKSGASGQEYLVRLLPNEDGGMCDCDWGKYRKHSDGYRSGCSHVQAVYQQMEGQRNRSTSAWSSVEDAKRQKRQITHLGDGVTLTLRKK